MEPRIEIINNRKLIGQRMIMSFVNNRTGELWRSFMVRRKEITNNLSNDLTSMQIYSSDYFTNFNPINEFVKWAAVEVGTFDKVPEGMEVFTLTGGMYAVFHHKGSSDDASIFQYIFRKWLPQSDYILDDRPHFEILSEKYRNQDPNSEEEIWIPVRSKRTLSH
jgi:AraC family transcriptional regulator